MLSDAEGPARGAAAARPRQRGADLHGLPVEPASGCRRWLVVSSIPIVGMQIVRCDTVQRGARLPGCERRAPRRAPSAGRLSDAVRPGPVYTRPAASATTSVAAAAARTPRYRRCDSGVRRSGPFIEPTAQSAGLRSDSTARAEPHGWTFPLCCEMLASERRRVWPGRLAPEQGNWV